MKQLLLFGAIVTLMATMATAYPRAKHERREEFEEIPLQGSGDDKDFLRPHNPDELVHHFTDEEIERNRWISIDRNGTETTATDNEVIAILEKVRKSNFSSSFSQPHFPVQTPLDIMVKKRKVIGTDGRYKHSTVGNPYCAIGWLESGCTAFLVGPYHAITAGHCVYDCNARKWKSDRGLYLRRNCYSRGIYMSEVRTWSYKWSDCTQDRYDIAWILLDKNDYTSSCWMGYGYRDSMPTIPGEICGYPADKPRGSYRCLYCSRCGDIKKTSSKRLQYTCDSYGGMNGGPVFTAEHNDKDYQYAYGVHTHSGQSYNKGTRFNSFYFEWTKQWKDETGG
jgi:V8-like Glu-specific endopeptidase